MSGAASERKIIATTIVAHAILHICELSFPAVAVLVARDLFGNPQAYEKVGFAYFVAASIFGAMAIPAGFLSDRFGPRKILLLYLFGSGVSMVMIGLARNYFTLVLTLSLMGGFIGIYHPAGLSLLSLGTKRHGFSMGVHGMGGNLGLALSPFLASLLADLVGWRAAFAALGLLPLAFGFYVLADRKIVITPEAESTDVAGDEPAGGKSIFVALAFLFMMATLNGMCYRGFTTFLPAYFKAEIPAGLIPGFSGLLQAGSLTTLVLIIGIFGQFLGGRLADRFSKEKIYTLVFILSAPFLFLLSRLEGMTLVLSAMAFAFFYFANQPVSNALVPRYVSRSMRGTIYGWFFFVSFGAGSVMSWIAGAIAEKISLSSIFALLSVPLVLAAILGFFLIRFRLSEKEEKI